MFESLAAKTFLILVMQLIITLAAVIITIAAVRRLFEAGHPAISASKNEFGEIDLHVEPEELNVSGCGLLILDVMLFAVLLGLSLAGLLGSDKYVLPATIVFAAWSAVTGALVAISLIEVDENIGPKVMGIAVLIVIGAGVVGMFSGIDFSWMGGILLVALLGLIIAGIVRLFRKMTRKTERTIAAIGVVVFTGFLLFDFNRLVYLERTGENSWAVALNLSIALYLDIINLVLDLIDLLA